jgi:hypothetical protein
MAPRSCRRNSSHVLLLTCSMLLPASCRNHWALQRRLEADKAFPTKNKHLDFTMCLAHGT